ncbi:MAG: DnaA N-terminal domain-containing protein [Acidobacteriota bacterium]
MSIKTTSDRLRKLIEWGYCQYDEEAKVVWVIEHARHEWGSAPNPNDKKVKGLKNRLPGMIEALGNCPLINNFIAHYRTGWAPLFEVLPKSIRRTSEVDSESIEISPEVDGIKSLEESGERREETGEKERGEPTSPEPSRAAGRVESQQGVVMTFPVIGEDSPWELTKEKLAEWEDTFEAMDVVQLLRRARQWLRDNPRKRKTPGGMTTFLGAWLERKWNGGDYPPRPLEPGGPESELPTFAPIRSERWLEAREVLRSVLDPDEWRTWIRPLVSVGETADDVAIWAPSPGFLHTLSETYADQINRAFDGPSVRLVTGHLEGR